MKQKRGFTLIEFLIGMSMTVMIFIVATNLVVSFLNVNSKSKRSQDVEQVKTDITRMLTDQLTWGSEISFDQNMLKIDNDTYTVLDSALLKNGTVITPRTVKVVSLDVKKFDDDGPDSTQTSYEVDVSLEHAESSSITDMVTIFASARQSNTDITTTQTPSP